MHSRAAFLLFWQMDHNRPTDQEQADNVGENVQRTRTHCGIKWENQFGSRIACSDEFIVFFAVH